MSIIEGLNPEQEAAVRHTEGPMLVVAGAGTGKTRVITCRVARLISEKKAKPGEVLALTFTEKAAREMEERLYELIGWQSFQVPVMTFHAFGTELLGLYAHHIGRSIRGGLLNETQKALLLQQHFNRVDLEYYRPHANLYEFLEGIVAFIGRLQNAGARPDDYEKYAENLKKNPGDMHPSDAAEQQDLAKLYRLYEKVKEETGTFDYNDQLDIPLRILKEKPNLAARLTEEYKYVLVDEYQDTNAVQDELLRSFIGREGNIFAVGDDDQAIYGFRGAEIGNILQFASNFNLKKPAVLVRNYRSGQEILDAAYRLIQHNNPDRLEAKLGINKRLVAVKESSSAKFVPYRRPEDERTGVAEAIEAKLASGEKASEIAVLSATHAPLTAIAKIMRRKRIPFALATAVNIFEQPELLGLWYLLQWLNSTADEETLQHVIMGPYIGWTADRCRNLSEAAEEELIGIEEALGRDRSEDAVKLVRKLAEWRGWAKELPVSELAFKLVFDTGRAEAWQRRAIESPRMVNVFEDLHKLLEQMQDYETVAIDHTVFGYLKVFPKPPVLEVTEPEGDAEGVQLLTVHTAKGLEFDSVYLIGCTQRSWSRTQRAALEVPGELRKSPELSHEHEYRRLMYVAATRARKELVVSAPVQAAKGGSQKTSPFVSELLGEAAAGGLPAGAPDSRMAEVEKKLQQFFPMKDSFGEGRLPFETADGWLELSVTQLDQYKHCPFEFYLQNVLRIRQPMGPQMSFGTVLHGVFQAYYQARLKGESRPAAELHALLDEGWSDRGYGSRELADADRDLAQRTLDVFIEREDKERGRKILGSEVPMRFELPEAKLRLRGKIDAYFETGGGIQLRDFKTGRGKPNEEAMDKKTKESLQLRTYALAYEILNEQAPSEVVLDFVVTGVVGTAGLSPTILKNHRGKLAEYAERIRGRDFAPDKSPMHRCPAAQFYGTGEQEEIAETAFEEMEVPV